MKEIHICEIIKQRRMELGLTQDELCRGICEPATMSRIENGLQTPIRSKLNALLQRLGLPSEKYYAMMSTNELEIEQLKSEIIYCNTRKLKLKGIHKLYRLSEIVENDDHITQQFILRSQAMLGYLENETIKEYSLEEKIQLLFQAIHLTHMDFDIDDIGRHWYSLDEIKIINQLAITYAENHLYEKATDIFHPLMNYLQKKFIITSGTATTAILIAYNYSNILCKQARYERAQEVAQWGYNKCLEWERSSNLGGLLFVLGECSYHHKEIEKSKEYFLQSYYVFKSLKNQQDSEIMKRNIKDHFDFDI